MYGTSGGQTHDRAWNDINNTNLHIKIVVVYTRKPCLMCTCERTYMRILQIWTRVERHSKLVPHGATYINTHMHVIYMHVRVVSRGHHLAREAVDTCTPYRLEHLLHNTLEDGTKVRKA